MVAWLEGDDLKISDCFVAPEAKKDRPAFPLGKLLPPQSGTQLAVLVSAALADFHYVNHVIVVPADVHSAATVGV